MILVILAVFFNDPTKNTIGFEGRGVKKDCQLLEKMLSFKNPKYFGVNSRSDVKWLHKNLQRPSLCLIIL